MNQIDSDTLSSWAMICVIVAAFSPYMLRRFKKRRHIKRVSKIVSSGTADISLAVNPTSVQPGQELEVAIEMMQQKSFHVEAEEFPCREGSFAASGSRDLCTRISEVARL